MTPMGKPLMAIAAVLTAACIVAPPSPVSADDREPAIVATDLAADATAATRGRSSRAGGARPRIVRVAPMRVRLRRPLAIRGRNFDRRARRNTVLLKVGRRVAIVKPRRATPRRLVMRVPPHAATLLAASAGRYSPTRVSLRVVSRRRVSRFTTRRLSPVVVGARCTPSRDSDGDRLRDALEVRVGLDPCSRHSDTDEMEDGWEYYSAKDLNLKAVPYPGKRPYPNPLYPLEGPGHEAAGEDDSGEPQEEDGDAGIDFDGDGLPAGVEHDLWIYTGRDFDRQRRGGHKRDSPLGYSDGTQTSRPNDPPVTPAFRFGSYDLPLDPPSYPERLERRPGPWGDDERDADADGLNNYVEVSGPGSPGWWSAWLSVEGIDAWPDSYFGDFTRRPFVSLDAMDPDVDGDELLDGEDDQDNDDVPNFVEMYDVRASYDKTGGRKNAFNPCAPDRGSRTCPVDVPLE